MRGTLRPPPPALVISVISLVVAVGGGTFAVAASDNKSDNKKDGKIANAVVSKRARGLSVANAANLGGRPPSVYARNAPLRHIAPTLENGWTSAGPSDAGDPGFAKDSFGIVHLFGAAVHSGLSSSTIFTLPVGDRPVQAYVDIPAAFPNPGTLTIEHSGHVRPLSGPTTFIDLEGITFAGGG